MKTTINKFIFIWILFSLATNCFSQFAIPFKMRYQCYVKGDMTIIANNNTNRKEGANGANISYDKLNGAAKHNDEFQMEYVDIDNDNNTFSSSSATLDLQKQTNKKIIYAGLYWSSTYTCAKSKKKSEEKFIAIDAHRDDFDNVKIKLPNQDHYIDIKGEVIFDGINEFPESAPYAVYADITKEVTAIENPFGTYTVANIKATQGMISGGVASGWTIFFIYEDSEMTGKFITSFDGFAGVTDRSTDILFDGFETLPEGKVKAKIAAAALEGDNGLSGDQLLFKTPNKNNFITLSNDLRSQYNFFNSSITVENQELTNRVPNSKNTLGYDSCIISIPNDKNGIIGNNTNEALLRLKSSGDRYFMFFTAFNVEVTAPSKPVNNYQSAIVSETKKEKIVEENIIASNITKEKNDIVSNATKQENIQDTNEPTEIKYVSINGFSEGYYIIANVFSKKENCTNFLQKLKDKGVTADSFFNTENNYYYVYIKKSDNKDEVEKLYTTKINNTYNDDLWILAVNIDNFKNDVIASNQNLNEETANKSDSKITIPTEIKFINIDNFSSGYYIIVNVFAQEKNCKNFINDLKNKGINSYSFVNPINDYYYVYLIKSNNKNEIVNLFTSNIKNTYLDNKWILSVNNPSALLSSDSD